MSDPVRRHPGEAVEALPPEFTLRPAIWADLEAVARLILDVCTDEGDPSVAIASSDLIQARTWSEVRHMSFLLSLRSVRPDTR